MHRETLQLLLGLAHEMRTPISAIAGQASLLSMGVHGPISEAQADSLRRIENNQQHLLTLIDDVVRYAEAASGTVALSPEPLPLWPLVLQAVDAMRAAADARGVRIEVSAPPENAADQALLDASAGRSILDAMLEDALAHSHRDSSILVSMVPAELVHSVQVQSAGGEASAGSLSSMFTPYARDERGRPIYAAGRSLALPLAASLCAAMGATLRSTPDGIGRALQFDVPRAGQL